MLLLKINEFNFYEDNLDTSWVGVEKKDLLSFIQSWAKKASPEEISAVHNGLLSDAYWTGNLVGFEGRVAITVDDRLTIYSPK